MKNWVKQGKDVGKRKNIRFTRELPGVALMNISNGQIYMGNGNTFIYGEISVIPFTLDRCP